MAGEIGHLDLRRAATAGTKCSPQRAPLEHTRRRAAHERQELGRARCAEPAHMPELPISRRRPSKVSSSMRAAESLRKMPRKRLVVVHEPGLRTPR